MRATAPMMTNSGLILTPYASSWKNLIRPALDAGIPGELSLFFFLLKASLHNT